MVKKSFKEDINPAMQFVSANDSQVEDIDSIKIPDGYKINPIYIEKRDRRMQILMQGSLYAKVKDRAVRDGVSMNECIHNILSRNVESE